MQTPTKQDMPLEGAHTAVHPLCFDVITMPGPKKASGSGKERSAPIGCLPCGNIALVGKFQFL